VELLDREGGLLQLHLGGGLRCLVDLRRRALAVGGAPRLRGHHQPDDQHPEDEGDDADSASHDLFIGSGLGPLKRISRSNAWD